MNAILGIVAEALPDIQAPQFSEEALALEFSRRHADRLRYVALWGCWMVWDGNRWLQDTKRLAFSMARDLCREFAAQVNKTAGAKDMASAKKRAAVLSLATDDQQLAATVDQWDQNPWLLNTPDGVVDLKSGQRRAAHPDDYITKITPVAPGGECPIWLKFLERITGGDGELGAFLQKVAGYSLTGETREHALFFLYGLGANGKSVFIATLAGILGDYHRTSAVETFTASKNDRHPTELAMLRGARLVTAVETEEGRRWAESRIKSLTGGDRISARFMRQDFFEFTPQFKLIVAGNHKPGLRAVDEAIRRRLNLIPFEVTIPVEERDPGLVQKLKAEWPGILRWAIEGCLEWQRIGLTPPDLVRAATDSYFEGEDAFGTWLADLCVVDAQAWAPAGALWESWKMWALRGGSG